MQFEKWRLYGRRLTEMNLEEVVDRTHKGVLKRFDSAMGLLGYGFATPRSHNPPRRSGHFFFDPESVDTILWLMRERIPGRAEQIIQEADHILRHQFHLLGYRRLDYRRADGLIDWHYDAVNKKRAPMKAFYRVRYLDYEECGDSKVIWELNRHQHFVTLAKAYRFTRDRRYVDEIYRQKRHWERENSYPSGINWASSLEVAFRSLSWLWTCHLLAGSRGMPDSRQMWLPGLALHGRHIERYLSTYFSPNTHLLGEAVALFFIGLLCPELQGAERWKSVGWATVLQESERQIRPDGFHFEQSTYYHVYALDLFIHTAVLASLNDIPLPKRFVEKIETMLDALAMMGRYGPPPRFGDDDGGRLFDPGRNREEHLLDPLSNGALLFRRGDFKNLAGGLREESLWLFGKAGVQTWDELQTSSVAGESCALRDAGVYFLVGDSCQLIVDAGPMGTGSGGHGHADALNISLQSRGRSLLADAGTFAYVTGGGERDCFRGTAIHNTLQVDGRNQADAATTFSWRKLTKTKVEQWVNGRSFDLFVAEHDGFLRLPQPVIHRRWIVSLRKGMYFVRDVVGGSGTHEIEITWNLAPELDLEEGWRFRAKGEESRLQIVPTQLAGWTGHVETGAWSSAYGHKVPNRVLRFRANVGLPAEFSVALLVSHGLEQGDASQMHLENKRLPGVSLYACRFRNSKYSFAFSEGRGEWNIGDLSSDANFVCQKSGPGEWDEELILSGGSYAKIRDGRELQFLNTVDWAELFVSEQVQTIFSSDQTKISDCNCVPTPLPALHAGC